MNEAMRTCEKCGAPDAQPYFTKPVREVKPQRGKQRPDYQPRWFCKKDKPRKVVSGI